MNQPDYSLSKLFNMRTAIGDLGVIRPQDINFDNTIAAASIADASISLTGEGVVADEQRKGWLAKILSKVWPF